MVQPDLDSSPAGGDRVVQQGEVLRGVSDREALCGTFPHTDAYACPYCRTHPSADADFDTDHQSDTAADAVSYPDARGWRTVSRKGRRRVRSRS